MGDRVEVDLAALTTFARTVAGLADDNTDRISDRIAQLVGHAEVLQAAGAAGFNEADLFTEYHGQLSTSAQSFLQDVVQGLSSLGAGAEYCALNYTDADSRNAAALKAARDGFDGSTLAGAMLPLDGRASIPSSGVDDAFAPNSEDALWGNDEESTDTGDIGDTDGTDDTAVGDGVTVESGTDQVDPPAVDATATQNDAASQMRLDGSEQQIQQGDVTITIPADQAGVYEVETPAVPKS